MARSGGIETGKIRVEKTRLAPVLVAVDLANPHKTQHKTMKRILLAALGILLAAAWLDVSTGVQLLDQLIQSVPIDWLRQLA